MFNRKETLAGGPRVADSKRRLQSRALTSQCGMMLVHGLLPDTLRRQREPRRKCTISLGYTVLLTDLFTAQAHPAGILVDELLKLVQLPSWWPDSFVRHCVYREGDCESGNGLGKRICLRVSTRGSRDFPESCLQLFPTGTSHQLGTS